MGYKCAVFSCTSNSDKMANDAVSFFEFPSSPTMKQNWLQSINRPFFKPLRSSRVCSKHFDEKYFVRNEGQVVLNKDAVPFSLNSPKKSIRRLTRNSKNSSDEGALSNTMKRGQDTSVTQEPQIGVKRPRRNTVFMGIYNYGIRNRVAAPSSEKQSGIEKHSANESDSITKRRGRPAAIGCHSTIVAGDTPRTNSASKENTTPVPPRNQSSIEKRPAKSSQPTLNSVRGSDEITSSNNNKRGRTNLNELPPITGMRPRRNTVFMGIYKFGLRNRVAVSTSQNQSSNQRSAETSANVIESSAALQVTRLNDIDVRSAESSDNQRTHRPSKEPRTTLQSLSHRRIDNQYSNESNLRIQRQRNAPVFGRNNFAMPAARNGNRINRVATPTTTPATAMMSTGMSQLSIRKFFGKQTPSVEPQMSNREECVFGWCIMGSHAVPFILQQTEKFCSLRMLEKSALAKYKRPTPKIGSCLENVEYFSPTTVQCELLNEINVKHCDGAYGKEKFSLKDKMVRMRDAYKYFTFVDLCEQPFMKGIRVRSEGLEFGFTLVNKKSFIPYALLNERKFIPLRYLYCQDEIVDVLKGKSQILSNGDALFLKFCCKFDGIMDVDDCIEVIELLEIQKLATPKSITFKDCWPADAVNYDLHLNSTKRGIRFQYVARNELKSSPRRNNVSI